MRFASRGMRQRGDSDKWEVTLSHRDPSTGKQIRTFHTVEGKTLKQAEKRRDILERHAFRKRSTRSLKSGAMSYAACP